MRVYRRQQDVAWSFEFLDDDGRSVDEVASFLRHLNARDCSPNTASAYAHDLLHFYRFLGQNALSIESFGPAESLGLLEYLRLTPSRRPARRLGLVLATTVAGQSATCLAPATINRVFATVSSFFEYLILAGRWGVENPIQQRPDPALARVSERHRPFMGAASHQRPVRRAVRVKTVRHLPRPLADEQVAALFSSLRRWRDRALLLLMLQGGLRPGEALSLHLEDVQYGRRRVIVRYRIDHPKGARTKSRTERVVDLHEPATLEALSRYVMDERPRDVESSIVFLVGGHGSRRCEPLSYAALVKLFQRHCEAAGIREPWLTPHALRHTHATRLWEGGMRELALQKRLGHASPESTRVYTRVSDPMVVAEYPAGIGDECTSMMSRALVQIVRPRVRQHAPVEEYDAYLERWVDDPVYRRMLRDYRNEFVTNYPDVETWFAAPLFERVGHEWLRAGVPRARQTVCHRARSYLHYLGLRGYAWFDWDWLLAIARHRIWELDERLGLSLRQDADALVEKAMQLGYFRNTALTTLRWTLSRLLLHAGNPHVAAISDDQLDDFADAIRQFGERSDIATFYGSRPRYLRLTGSGYLNYVHALRVVLYHRGQIAAEPRRRRGGYKQRVVRRPRMEAVAMRFLAARRLTDRPTTVASLEHALREFIAWLCTSEPNMETFAEVTRDQVLAYGEYLATARSPHTGRPYAVLTRRGRLAALAVFFRDVAQWRWEDVPAHPLLAVGDLPRIPQRIPRFIPEHELARLMDAIRLLQCPYQRAALLIARWSGARRDEVRRLALDALDAYPDGTPRLRIPAGKTKRERMVPLNEEAAEAIRNLQANRALDRGFCDPITGVVSRYLFVKHGQRLSKAYLFDRSLEIACGQAGLVESNGRHSITAHRFRHTVGTQLAERGAKLHTIMQVLGHTSASMSMVYARISDREVLRDYQAVLGPGAVLAGPSAEILRAGGLSPEAVDWLQTNFFKTELELGHCLRLPQEGPCECDLYLTCAKFVTTREYAPRLRARRERELGMIADAESRSWPREAERHRCTVQRIEQLLAELGESAEIASGSL